MNLGELLNSVREINDDKCIFARKPWTPTSEAVSAALGENFQVPADIAAAGLDYFLEVHVAKEVLQALSNRPTSKEEEVNLLIFYAENDAYPNWIYN
jgi:hypothetical protein